jgi:hypothetical protein
MRRSTILGFATLALLLAPQALIYAQTFILCDGNACNACLLVKLANNVIQFLIIIAIFIATIMFMWAGYQFVTAGGNQTQLSNAKKIFTDVLIGILIVLTGFLIVDTVMKLLVGQNLLEGGPWNEVQCVANPSMTSPGSWVPGQSVTFGPDGQITVNNGPRGDVLRPGSAASLAQAAQMAFDQRMSTQGGPDGGNLACVWAVNRMMEAANMQPFGTDNVFVAEREIQQGRGQGISQTEGRAGDIVIVSDGPKAHIGVCANAGCTQVINNSSSRAAVTNSSPPSMGYSTQPRFYRLNN